MAGQDVVRQDTSKLAAAKKEGQCMNAVPNAFIGLSANCGYRALAMEARSLVCFPVLLKCFVVSCLHRLDSLANNQLSNGFCNSHYCTAMMNVKALVIIITVRPCR